MTTRDTTFLEDMERISRAGYIPWEKLRGQTILVTGATGLIGHTLVSALLYTSERKDLDLTVLALVRDEQRARRRFGEAFQQSSALRYIVGTMEAFPAVEEDIGYIVHAAGETGSKAFVEKPVETIFTALRGTESVLDLSREKHVKGLVYLSSMEVYGHPPRGHKVAEGDTCALDPLDVRNSYPIGKVQCESLCNAYASEYGVPAKIVRLTQTFGPGVSCDDKRIFAELGRCVAEKRDIVLKTMGETERCYLYTADAVTAILTVLLRGEPGQAYNAANEETYCSIAEMARRVAKMGGVQVRFDIRDDKASGYLSTLYMDLDTSRLKALGWVPAVGTLEEMFARMMAHGWR